MNANNTDVKQMEKGHINEFAQPKSVKPKNVQQEGFNWVRNNDFFSKMLDLDPSRHNIIENDWQEESILATLQNNLDILPKNPGIYPTEAIAQHNP